jgi:hypothetical protein
MRCTASARVAVLVLIATTARAGELWVPVVAQMPGAGGSYWNTEMWISNLGASSGSCAVTFLPSGTDNTDLLLSEATPTPVPAGHTVYVGNVVPPRSSGALRVVTVGDLVVQVRLFNTQGQGAVGQIVPALGREQLIPIGSEGHLVPILRSSRFRTNVGLFNPSPSPVKVQARLLDPQGAEAGRTEYALEPGSQTQVNDLLLGFKVNRSDGHQLVLSAGGPFAAYASVVDTRTGAPTLILPEVR